MKKKLPASLLIIIFSYFLVSVALIATAASNSSILVNTPVFYTGLVFLIFSVLLWVGLSKVRMVAIVLSSLFASFLLVVFIYMILGKATINLTVDLDSLTLPVGMSIIYIAVLLLISFMAWQLKALFSADIKAYFENEVKVVRVDTDTKTTEDSPPADNDGDIKEE
ncbi:hypothetical protein AB2B38_012210 [Balneola sp. MJW-20]|uniref:hypothetical protein n=1 Tax=Gracilimonas aurantiaca TaxID=3234185 RepID=UPI0034675806